MSRQMMRSCWRLRSRRRLRASSSSLCAAWAAAAIVPAQFTRGVTPIQLATGQQAEQHGRLAPDQAEHEVAGGGYLVELLPVQRAPGLEVEFRVGSHRIADELLVARDQRAAG
ncbi:hypothetical protein PPS11_22464 [Pseudomonas putida S11]|nr:hypothetical protein PPS11_22464 [Pseudomonas putida S11]